MSSVVRKRHLFLLVSFNNQAESAIVAFSFLCMENSTNARAVYDQGAMPLLLPLAFSDREGPRSAVNSIMRQMIIEDAAIKKKFVELGGIEAFVKVLDPVSSNPNMDLLMESVLNLYDLLEDYEGSLNAAYAKQAMQYDVKSKLLRIKSYNDPTVTEAIDQILDSFAQAGIR